MKKILLIAIMALSMYSCTTAALYDAKTKEIMSQPKMIELYKAETDRLCAQKGVSPYGNNNVFGSSSNILLNR